MKIRADLFVLALLSLISSWSLTGCSQQEPAASTKNDSHNEAEVGDEHSKHAEAAMAGHNGNEHAAHHDHQQHGHEKVEQPHHAGAQHSGSHQSGGHKADGHHSHKHQDNKPAVAAKVKVGEKVPDFTVQTLDGKSVKLSELQKDETRTKSGVIAFSFWCSTCHSCRDVEQLLAELAKAQEGEAAVIALAANADETAKSVAAFVNKNKLELPVVLETSGNAADLFGVSVTTTTVVIDGDGVLRYCGQFRQKNGGGSAEAALKAVLAGNEVAIKTTPPSG